MVFASPTVYMDGREGPTRRRCASTSPETNCVSHFSYSYYESSESGNGGNNAKVLYSILRKESYLPGTHTGIQRYDTARASSNNTAAEVENAEDVLPYPAGYWAIFAVLDARNGNSTATWLRENIVYAIGGALVDLYSRLYESNPLSSQPPAPSTSDIERTLKCTFKQLDHDIVHGSVDRVLSTQAASHSSKVDPLARAYSGSSALVGFYDSNSRDLHAALTGDSRAVLGRRMQGKNSDVGYQAHVLTVEQDGGNLAEEYRLNARHPGEAVVYAGRFPSGGPTRSFGDAMYKCQDRNTHRQLQDASQAVGQPVPSHVKSPPYLTAEPEVTSTSVQPGDFLIMGTRGIWDRLTSEEAVGPIGTWLDEQRQRQSEHTKKNPAISANDFPVSPLEVNAWQDETDDRNAATHLMKNALSRHLSGEGSGSLTITVIFFTDNQAVSSQKPNSN